MDRAVRGIVPVLQTPLKGGEIDEASLRRHVEWLIQKPIGGLWVLGTGSEDMHLTFGQRLKVAQVACDANHGKVPLFLGCSFYSFSDTERFIEITSDLNYDAYHYMPYHPLLSWDRLLSVYEYLSKIAPMWGYSSANWSRSMPPDFVKQLKESGIRGIKYSSQRTSDMQKVIALQDTFQVITAVATQFLVCLQMGARGSTTSLAGVHPDLFTKCFETFQRGKIEVAERWQGRIGEFASKLNVAKKHNFLSGAEEKVLLKWMGLYETSEMTFPYVGLTHKESERLIQSVESLYAAQP